MKNTKSRTHSRTKKVKRFFFRNHQRPSTHEANWGLTVILSRKALPQLLRRQLKMTSQERYNRGRQWPSSCNEPRHWIGESAIWKPTWHWWNFPRLHVARTLKHENEKKKQHSNIRSKKTRGRNTSSNKKIEDMNTGAYLLCCKC